MLSFDEIELHKSSDKLTTEEETELRLKEVVKWGIAEKVITFVMMFIMFYLLVIITFCWASPSD